MFWNRFDAFMNRGSSVHDILSSQQPENVKVSDLLAKDDCIAEAKARNGPLMKVLTRPEILRGLVELITEEPPGELEAKDHFKECTVACEVLNADAPEIMDVIVASPEYLDMMFGYFAKNTVLNPILTAFISRTLGLLVSRKPLDMLEYITKKEDLLDITLKHLNVSSVVDLYLRIITGNENDVYRYRICEWLDSKQLVQRVVKFLDAAEVSNSDLHTHAAQLIVDIIRFSREQQLQQLKPDDEVAKLTPETHANRLLITIDSEEFIRTVVDLLEKSSSSQSATSQCLAILGAPFEFIPVNFDGNSDQRELFNELSLIVVNARIDKLSRIIAPRVPILHDLLRNPPMRNTLISEIAEGRIELTQRVGQVRLQLVRILALLLSFGRTALNEAIRNSGIVITLLDMFFRFPYNSFFHAHIQNCISLILRFSPLDVSSPINPSKDHPLLHQLLVSGALRERIMKAWVENEDAQQLGKYRRPFMGHLTIIAVDLAGDFAINPILAAIYQASDDELNLKWTTFLTQKVQPLVQRQARCLGGVHPAQQMSTPPVTNGIEIDFSAKALEPKDVGREEDPIIRLETMDTSPIVPFPPREPLSPKVMAERAVGVMRQESQEDSDEEDDLMEGHQIPVTASHQAATVVSPRKATPEWPEQQPLNFGETDGLKRLAEAENANSPWENAPKVSEDIVFEAWGTANEKPGVPDESWADFSALENGSNNIEDPFTLSRPRLSTRESGGSGGSDTDDAPFEFKASAEPESDSPVLKDSENVFNSSGDVPMDH